ncbi:universal stress protein [Myxacorys almedinensis]|uniref:Universal stress protein n=1 Tax=Myxacorys almedinensis A TaxID=2690445 RepID=A0A8J7Z4Q2_9CYAN|nr:universal stress protein [Myxacorys almedinensis]NDJ16393.1 universal stress protein [Myxacorys almedinensis A]
MLNTVLVALDIRTDAAMSAKRTSDGTAKDPLCDQVLKALGQLQLQQNTRVVLAHSVPTDASDVDISADRPHANVESFPYAQIEQQLRSYQTQLPYQSEIEIVKGDPAEEMLRLANIYKADLIIIGSRGLTGIQRILLGSVSSQVVSDAPCSVWVVKPTEG